MQSDKEKFILIISQNEEKSTDDVLQYLIYYSAKFIRINQENIISKVALHLGCSKKLQIECDGVDIDLEQIRSVWYRRGKLNLQPGFPDYLTEPESELYGQYLQYYNKEAATIVSYLYRYLDRHKHLNRFADNQISKLYQLETAQQAGLRIPDTYVTNDPEEIKSCMGDRMFVLKALDFHIFTFKSGARQIKYAANSSVLVNRDNIDRIMKYGKGRYHLISLFQEYISKKFEIRVFYLFGKLFSMAIFSQENEKTKIDFRNYDYERPNRTVPFNLPLDLEQKIIQFMKLMQLDCGSLDILYTKDKEYYFLEVNPIGQFDWLSKGCNYFIDREIAKELIYDAQ